MFVEVKELQWSGWRLGKRRRKHGGLQRRKRTVKIDTFSHLKKGGNSHEKKLTNKRKFGLAKLAETKPYKKYYLLGKAMEI